MEMEKMKVITITKTIHAMFGDYTMRCVVFREGKWHVIKRGRGASGRKEIEGMVSVEVKEDQQYWKGVKILADILVSLGGAKKYPHVQFIKSARKPLSEYTVTKVIHGYREAAKTLSPEKLESMRRILYDLETVLPFGKHRGKPVKEVIDKHPGWIAWALKEISDSFLDEEAREYFETGPRKRAEIQAWAIKKSKQGQSKKRKMLGDSLK